MSLTALLFLSLGGLSVIIGIFVLSGFVHYKVKKKKQPPVKINPVNTVRYTQPEPNSFYTNNPIYYYREINRQTTFIPRTPPPNVPANKQTSVKDVKKAKLLRIEVLNYYGPEDDNNRYYYGN